MSSQSIPGFKFSFYVKNISFARFEGTVSQHSSNKSRLVQNFAKIKPIYKLGQIHFFHIGNACGNENRVNPFSNARNDSSKYL